MSLYRICNIRLRRNVWTTSTLSSWRMRHPDPHLLEGIEQGLAEINLRLARLECLERIAAQSTARRSQQDPSSYKEAREFDHTINKGQ